MCRHLAYLGPPVSPSWAVLEAPHSLRVQSYAPQDMRCGAAMNADGFGLGWYSGDGEPSRYRRSAPLWTDESLPSFAGSLRCTAFLAAVRSATVGMPVIETACAPFAWDRWLFSHNGVVTGWPDSVLKLAESLPVRELLTMDAPTDSALVWALLRHRLRAGAEPGAALAELTGRLAEAAPGSKLNFLLTDGDTLWASTWWHALSVRTDPAGTVELASEPVDAEPGWQPVPDAHLVVATRAACHLYPIDREQRQP